MAGEDLSAEKTLDELDLCERTPVVTPLDGDGRGWLFDIEPRRGGLGSCDVLVNGVRRFSLKVGEMNLLGDGHYQVAVTPEQVAPFATDDQVEVRVVARTADGSLTSRGGSKWQSVADVMPERGPEPPSFHGLFVGINDYKGEGLNLKYAAADARDLSAVVEAAANKLFSPENVHVTTLLSDRAAGAIYDKPQRHRLLQAIADIAEQSGPRDVLMIHLAGHGTINEEGQFVFLTAEASSLQEGDYTGVTMKDINDALMAVPASNRILILDACHSGGAINNVLGEAVAFAGVRDDKQLREEIARDRQISRLGDDASLAMLSASASDQAAFELQEVGHGLLTYALLEAIDGSLDILVDGEFLAIENWLMRAKQTVNEKQSEVNADGPVRQRAQWLPPTSNYAIGKVDDEVRELIRIDERPVISRIVFEDENEDFATEFEQKLGELLDASSARGGILFQEKHPKGINLKGTAIARDNGTYDVSFSLKRKGELLGQGEGYRLTIQEIVALIKGQLIH